MDAFWLRVDETKILLLGHVLRIEEEIDVGCIGLRLRHHPKYGLS